MSITKRSATEWDLVTLGEYDNEYNDIEATKDGLLICDNLISWAELEEAKKAAQLGG